MFTLRSTNKCLTLDSPKVMGIVNVTPDSFSDGGQFAAFQAACEHVDSIVAAGVDIIDIGGESTRPGAAAVPLAEELERVIPLIRYVTQKHHNVWISIDTSKAEVMSEAIAAGAHLINDVRALQEPRAIEVAAELDVPVCIMHMQGQPDTMQAAPQYSDVIEEISQFFERRVAQCIAGGIKPQNIIIDPGFGFGKTLDNNYQILAHLRHFSRLQLPILAGLSRKSMFGKLLGYDVDKRLAASLAGALLSIQNGANIVRVHDVQETLDVIKVWQQTLNY